jgi:hypothetical protein
MSKLAALQARPSPRPEPCRERSDYCAPNGDCLRCGAVQGEVCREPLIVAYRPEGEQR